MLMSSTVSCVSYTKHSHNVGWLVVSTPQYESVGMIIPNIWKNKKCSKPPTTWQIYQNIQKHSKTWGVPNNGGGTPKAGWFIMKNPTIKRMIWGYPHDLGNLHIQKDITTTRWGLMILLSFEHHLLLEKWQESHQNWNWAEKKTQ